MTTNPKHCDVKQIICYCWKYNFSFFGAPQYKVCKSKLYLKCDEQFNFHLALTNLILRIEGNKTHLRALRMRGVIIQATLKLKQPSRYVVIAANPRHDSFFKNPRKKTGGNNVPQMVKYFLLNIFLKVHFSRYIQLQAVS